MGESSYFSLERLALAAGMTARNVRAYQTRGLLPSPLRDGRSVIYDDGHLNRLQQIRHLRSVGVPLRMITEAAARGESLGEGGPLFAWATGQLQASVTDSGPKILDLRALEAVENTAPGTQEILRKAGLLPNSDALSSGAAVNPAVSAMLSELSQLTPTGVDGTRVVQAAVSAAEMMRATMTDKSLSSGQRIATARLATLVVQASIATMVAEVPLDA